MEKTNQELSLEIETLKSKLISQEHRLVPSLINVYVTFFKTRSNRKEALTALLWNLLYKAPITATISLAGFLSVYLAFKANESLDNQNKLIEKQNSLITSQNRLSEAQRRATLVPELTRVLDEILIESKNGSPENPIKLSRGLEARTIALSKALKPYYFLDYGDELSKHELSPERGHLLIALTESNVDITNIVDKGDFGWALLQRVWIEGVDFQGSRLGYVNADGARFVKCNFSRSNLWGARFSGAVLDSCDLSGLKLNFANLHGIFKKVNFTKTQFSGALMPGTYLLQNCKFQDASFHHAFVNDSTWLEEMDELINNKKIFDKSKYKVVAYRGEEKIQIEKMFDYLRHDLTQAIYQIESVDSVGHSH